MRAEPASGCHIGSAGHQGILEQNRGLDRPALIRQRQQHDVELALVQRLDQPRGLLLDQIELELTVSAAQLRQHLRQQERADGRDGAEPQRAAQRLARGANGRASARRNRAMILRARSTVSRPSGVSTTVRLLRSTSVASSRFSSSLMLALSVDWVTKAASAARPKWAWSASAIRCRRWRTEGRCSMAAPSCCSCRRDSLHVAFETRKPADAHALRRRHSVCCQKVRITLRAKGLDWEARRVPLCESGCTTRVPQHKIPRRGADAGA